MDRSDDRKPLEYWISWLKIFILRCCVVRGMCTVMCCSVCIVYCDSFENVIDFSARATDPFVVEDERVKYVDELCERVCEEAEGPQIAVRILAHKLLSPEQTEALNTLKAIDMCVRRCGTRLHNEIAKFRFLNQMVRLLSPKYNGDLTSDEVKTKAIELLFIWQKSMRHLTKFKQVYDMLKEQKVILEDPVLTSEPIRVTPPCRLATFEDEEKANLLSQLLKSNNPEDLQAANRLIKSMEEQKMERLHKRVDDVEKAKNNCQVLNEILTFCNTHPMTERESDLASELYSVLIEIRPTLFRYASEAAEYDDNGLADILAALSTNLPAKDGNKRSRSCSGGPSNTTKIISGSGIRSATSTIDNLLSNKTQTDTTSSSHDVTSTRDPPLRGIFQLKNVLESDDFLLVNSVNTSANGVGLDADTTSRSLSLCDDVALISLSSISSSREPNESSENASGIESNPSSALQDLSELLLDQSAFHKEQFKQLALFPEFLQNEREGQFLEPFQFANQICAPSALLEGVFVLLEALSVYSVTTTLIRHISKRMNEIFFTAARPPLIIFDENFMRGMLYFSQNSPPGTRCITTTVITMSSTNTVPLTNIKLSISTKTPNIQSRLFDAESDILPAFSPMNPHSTISQILLILPLIDSIEMVSRYQSFPSVNKNIL
ncbi:unnamed protein product [Anisakis simplex]|uniref:ADP-ribosylation factor-binding protein GGA1 n=1 Tax=Anisakis simplex TaxID=6269 RepID=A0A0M3JRK2_ANISI|nr:unnamed protein product [Anisakis simplex]